MKSRGSEEIFVLYSVESGYNLKSSKIYIWGAESRTSEESLVCRKGLESLKNKPNIYSWAGSRASDENFDLWSFQSG